jgi:ribosomal protein S4E
MRFKVLLTYCIKKTSKIKITENAINEGINIDENKLKQITTGKKINAILK